MRNNDNIIFIDYKGVSHNARVQSFREHRDAQGALIHQEPLVTLNYNGGPGGEPLTLIDVPHISHPSRQENNPDLPSYPLHAWKHDEEEHRELPEDHPVHDHFNEQPQKDEQGNIIPKKRPHYEAHIAQHREGRAVNDARVPESGEMPEGGPTHITGTPVYPAFKVGHPANPETVKFPFECASCGVSVTRTASHHGGKQYDVQTTGVNEDGSTKATNPLYVEHVCKQEDIDAFRKKIEDAKKPPVVEPSAAERLAAGEQLAPEVKKPEVEADVIAELEKAPPAPSGTEKPEDAA